jgi:hypothetical protein
MKKPTKPKRPKKPSQPIKDKITYELLLNNISLNSIAGQGCTIPLLDLQRNILEKLNNKSKKLSDIKAEELFIKTEYGYGLNSLFISVFRKQKTANLFYSNEFKEYQKKFKKYEEDMNAYEVRIKQFNINLQLWAAWKIKEEQEKLEYEVSALQAKIKIIEERKKEMLTEDCQQVIKKDKKND